MKHRYCKYPYWLGHSNWFYYKLKTCRECNGDTCKEEEYCPPFDFELYVDGESAEASFFGFDGNKLEISVRGPELEPGTHEIRLVIDSENVVEESNEENNDITFAVDAPGTES